MASYGATFAGSLNLEGSIRDLQAQLLPVHTVIEGCTHSQVLITSTAGDFTSQGNLTPQQTEMLMAVPSLPTGSTNYLEIHAPSFSI